MSQPSLRSLVENYQSTMPPDSTYLPDDWAVLSRYWYPVARIQEVGEKPLSVTLLDVKLVLFRTDGGLTIGRDLCPHRGVPLSLGCVQANHLVCPYHGLQFDGQGTCRKIPAHPDYTPSVKFNLKTYPAVERYGLVWTCLSPNEESAIPPMDAWDDPSFETILPPYVDIGGSPARQVEGFVDVAHFAFVHDKAFADPENPVVPSYETEKTDFGVRTNYVSQISNYPKAIQDRAAENFSWRRVYEVFPPFVAKLTVHFPEGKRYHILNAASPVSAHQTRLFVPIARNFDALGTVEEVLKFNAQVFAEDKAMVERQSAIDLRPGASLETPFGADKTSMAYRRALRDLGLTFA